jgi:translation elongation factor EF-G
MEQHLILKEWLQRKLSFNSYWFLQESITIEYEFKGARMGHPSNYAFVRFEVTPAESLSFQSTVSWLDYMSSEWIPIHEEHICEGIVDGLVCTSTTPFIGCALNLTEIKYHEVSSSPVAFHRATKEAMAKLIQTGRWGLTEHKKP